MNTPQQVAAPVAIPFPSQGDGEQRSPGISLADGVNQFLYIYEDVIVAAGTLRAILNFFEKKIPALRHPSLQEWMGRQEEELRAIAGDIADVCNDLIPGAPAAFGLEVQFLNPFEPFPLPGGSDQTNKVSQKLTPVPPEWMSSRQK